MANFNIYYLVVAGGGGASGGSYNGQGGGAGGFLTNYSGTALSLTTGVSYSVSVGDGGASTNNGAGVNGSNSVFASITSDGGGGGGAGNASTGGAGGSGGAGSVAGGTATSGQGNNGGVGDGPNGWVAGGGGGASAAGGNISGSGATWVAGNGGNGLPSSITGTATTYAGGGGGGAYNYSGYSFSPGTGGTGGGGNGSNSTNGSNGTDSLGGGGGGGNSRTTSTGGRGGSGVVILRYATADVASYTSTGLTPTETTDGTDTILSFTTVGTGTITFTTPIPPFSGNKVTTPVTDFNKPNTEEGLKIPSGTASDRPIGVEGMIRNSTADSSKGSATAITYYNGTNWRYFENELSTNFNTVLYTGDGNTTAQPVTGVGFTPDLVWIKPRNQAVRHILTDSVRGVDSQISSSENFSEINYGEFNTFDSDGFTVKRNTGTDYLNQSGIDYVAWCFKAGGLINKAADFNGSGSIQSSISKTTLANNFSVSFWWKPDLMNTFQVPIGGLYDETGGLAYGWMIYQGSDNKMYLYWIISTSPNTSNNISNDVVLEKGKWYHVVVTKTSSSASIYVDKSSASSSPSQGNIFNIVYNTNPSFYIGKRNVSNNYANGIINQVRVFTNALSASQVTQLYNETKADNSVLNFPSGAGCVAAYPLGENANGLDGLYNGAASSITFGKPGYLTRNTEGTIESTVSANNDLGFSIVSYTGNGTAGSTVGHGLDSTPEMIIVKSLTTTANQSWSVYQVDVGNNGSLTLELINTAYYDIGYWNNTSPTSSVFTLGYYAVSNQNNADYIAYCFASKPNYSKTGSYLGNGNATGPIVTLGFEPAFVMIKGVNEASGWTMLDNKRDTSNPNSARLDADDAMAEYNAVGIMDFNSDGFQLKTSSAGQNASGKTFIYLAFANTI